jgi:hypothetical protein
MTAVGAQQRVLARAVLMLRLDPFGVEILPAPSSR